MKARTEAGWILYQIASGSRYLRPSIPYREGLMLAAIKDTINSSSANKLRFEVHQRYFKLCMIKIHISEPLLNTHLFNLIQLISHQMYHIKEKITRNMSLDFSPRSVFLQKYRHVSSAPDKRQKRMVRYKEQEVVTWAIFFI